MNLAVHHAELLIGRVYATKSLPSANFLSVPCVFPDLRDDRLVKGAIRIAVEKQLERLKTQKDQGAFVQRLIELLTS